MDQPLYAGFIHEIQVVCEKYDLTMGGGGNVATGHFRFGVRPKEVQDQQEDDYLGPDVHVIRQLHNDPVPPTLIRQFNNPLDRGPEVSKDIPGGDPLN